MISFVDPWGSVTFKPEDLHIVVKGHRAPFERNGMDSYLLYPHRQVPHS